MSPEPEHLSWRQYERDVYEQLRHHYPDEAIQHDAALRGDRSERSRQIDILVRERLDGTEILTAFETKYYARPVDIKEVESFLGMLNDIGVDRGVMVCPRGYTRSAYQRAHSDEVDLDLDIFTYDEFLAWQAPGAIPYSGDQGILTPAPFGWVIDFRRINQALAHLYRRGIDVRDAYVQNEYMYVNVWSRDDTVHDLDRLLEKQNSDLLKNLPGSSITITDFASRENVRTCLRRFESQHYPSAEFTAFAEFERSILFVVMFSPLQTERRNLRKLEYLVQKVIPVHISHAA